MHARGLSLGFAQFLSLLVHTAHARMGDAPPTAPIPRAAAAKEPAPAAAAAAAPSHAPARAAAAAALPAALSSMLTGLVLPRAPRDSAQALREAILGSDALLAVLQRRGAHLRGLWTQAQKVALPAAARAGASGAEALASAAARGGGGGVMQAKVQGVTAAALLVLLDARGALGGPVSDVGVASAAGGAPPSAAPLDALMVRECFLDACVHMHILAAAAPPPPAHHAAHAAAAAAAPAATTDPSAAPAAAAPAAAAAPLALAARAAPAAAASALDYATFLECLCRCAHRKYTAQPTMSLSDRVEGLLQNL